MRQHPNRSLFCIYSHSKKGTGEVFYIGRAKFVPLRGRFERAYSPRNRNVFWKNVAFKYGYDVEILKTFDNIQDADEEERRLIALYGKKADGGLLCNLADGGEGNAGAPKPPSWKEKMSLLMKGRKLSKEHIDKLKKAHTGRKLSEEHKKAISLSSKKLKNFKLLDPEVVKKAREALSKVKKKPRTKEHQDKINEANRGQKRSLEARKKMSEARKKYFALIKDRL